MRSGRGGWLVAVVLFSALGPLVGCPGEVEDREERYDDDERFDDDEHFDDDGGGERDDD